MFISRMKNRPDLITNPNGEVIQEILGAGCGGVNNHSLAAVTIPFGRSSTPHFHKHAVESYLILEGCARLEIDDRQFQLQAGDACLIEPEEVHRIWNEETKNLHFLAICVPAWTPEDSFEPGEAR